MVELVAVLTVVSLALVALLDMEVATDGVVAGSTALLLLVLAHGAIAFAVGAATGRRTMALGAAAGLAVTGFMLDAIGPAVDLAWMSTISPFSWALASDPVGTGFDLGVLRLAVLAVLAMGAGLVAFERRDLMV